MKYIFLILIPFFLFFGCKSYNAIDPNPNKQSDSYEVRLRNELIKHNETINEFIKNPSPIVIWAKMYVQKHGETLKVEKKQITINNYQDAVKILQNFKLDESSTGIDPNGYMTVITHDCTGHIKVEFNINGKTFLFSFDHGSGIQSPFVQSYKKLKTNQATKLVELLKGYGFNKTDMGL